MFICVPGPIAPLTAAGCKSDVCLNLAKTFEFVIPIDAPYAHIVCSTVAKTFALARGSSASARVDAVCKSMSERLYSDPSI